jgi:hypothetical protein
MEERDGEMVEVDRAADATRKRRASDQPGSASKKTKSATELDQLEASDNARKQPSFKVPRGYKLAIDNVCITPSELQTWSPEELTDVEGLNISRPGYGKITWLEPVDLSGGKPFDKIIFIGTDAVEIYADDYENKPAPGSGLNKKIMVEMYNHGKKRGGQYFRCTCAVHAM